MGHALANDLLTNFIDMIIVVGNNNKIQIFMDGSSTNWKFFKILQKDCIEKEQHELIFIRSCSLHIIDSAFKTGAESTRWNIKAIFKGVFTILYDTSANRKYIAITGEGRFSLSLCATWWVEDTFVGEQLTEIWIGNQNC